MAIAKSETGVIFCIIFDKVHGQGFLFFVFFK